MAKAPFLHTHCPQCGAEMKYGGKKLTCGACGYSRKLGDKSDSVVERPLSEGVNLSAFDRGLEIEHTVYTCCGVKVAAPSARADYRCPFCNQPVEKTEETIQVIRPQGIVPFTIPFKDAPGRFAKWGKKIPWFFRPKGFEQIGSPERVHAIYVPVFTFDAFTRSSWKAESGYNDIFPADYQGASKGKPNTRWETSRGYLEHNFSMLMQAMGVKVSGDVYNALKIEELTGEIVEQYSPLYVQEFACELYQVDEKKGFEAGDKAMNEQIKGWITPMIPGDSNRDLGIVTEKLALSFKHVLMPVWVSGFRYRKVDHLFFLNGRNGRIHGKSPLSWEKVALVIGAGVILLILLVLGVDYLRF